MADKRPSGFRFRLPWLPKLALTPSPVVAPEPPSQPTRSAPPIQPPRTTTQTSAQRPPFRPPGKAPAPAAQPTVATPAPASPRQSPPQSVSSPQPPPPPPPVPAKSPVTKSPIAKSVEPVGIQPTKETEATTETTPALETPGLATPPQRSPLGSPRQSQSPPSPPQTPPPFILTESSPPESPMAKTIETVGIQPTKETEATTETTPALETPGLATPPQRSPLRSPRQSQSPPSPPQTPPPSILTESSPSESPMAKTIETVATQPAKETEATTETTPALETPGLATPPQRSPLRSPRQSQSPPSSPQTPPPSILTESSPPESAKTIETVATQPAKDSQTLTETMPTIETPGPETPPQRSPIGPPKQAQPQPGPPQTPPPSKPNSQPSSPSRMRTPPQPNSQHLLPSQTVAQPNVPTNPSSLSPESTRTRATTHPLSPVHVQPSQTRTPPKSPSRSPSPPTKTTSEFAELKRPAELTGEKFPNDSNHAPQADNLALYAKPRDITNVKGPETESMNLHSLETKSQKPTTTTRLPLHREIKDDISQFINKISAASLPKQYIDEKHVSIITLAGENKGASMHLASDNATKRDSKLGDSQEPKAILNSNAQGINNSMMFNSSATERSPGVHLRISRDLASINDSDMSDTDSMEMQRAEVNVTPAQKLVYNPAFGIDDLEISVTGNEIEVL